MALDKGGDAADLVGIKCAVDDRVQDARIDGLVRERELDTLAFLRQAAWQPASVVTLASPVALYLPSWNVFGGISTRSQLDVHGSGVGGAGGAGLIGGIAIGVLARHEEVATNTYSMITLCEAAAIMHTDAFGRGGVTGWGSGIRMFRGAFGRSPKVMEKKKECEVV